MVTERDSGFQDIHHVCYSYGVPFFISLPDRHEEAEVAGDEACTKQ